jgi:2-dehydro-3-deoxy-D-arabinonate dehydratase
MESMKLYRTNKGFAIDHNGVVYQAAGLEWDALLTEENPLSLLLSILPRLEQIDSSEITSNLRAPIGSQEVWAAGVTYFRSRDARMEEAKAAGGGDFYDRVYEAERPELFFKATPSRVVGPNTAVAIRDDAKWSVPEPEWTLLISPGGKITGYTIGNDMSSRDIEGENPLYLPQAKVYNRSCALGPCILLADGNFDKTTEIKLEIFRNGNCEFAESTTLASLKRDPESLVEYLYRNNTFPQGAFLMTGTGIVPPDSFTLQPNDRIEITIPPIGTLVNTVG